MWDHAQAKHKGRGLGAKFGTRLQILAGEMLSQWIAGRRPIPRRLHELSYRPGQTEVASSTASVESAINQVQSGARNPDRRIDLAIWKYWGRIRRSFSKSRSSPKHSWAPFTIWLETFRPKFRELHDSTGTSGSGKRAHLALIIENPIDLTQLISNLHRELEQIDHAIRSMEGRQIGQQPGPWQTTGPAGEGAKQ